jgi:hypothetical protein
MPTQDTCLLCDASVSLQARKIILTLKDGQEEVLRFCSDAHANTFAANRRKHPTWSSLERRGGMDEDGGLGHLTHASRSTAFSV